MTITNDLLKRIAFAVLGLSLIGYGYWLQSGGRNAAPDKPTPVTNAASATAESRAPALVKVPIKDMRVGIRVPAFNPEVSAAERRTFTEPNWYQWMKLKLELPKPDGTMLEIEMLRPEDWLIEKMTLVVEPIPVMLSGNEDYLLSAAPQSPSIAPIENTIENPTEPDAILPTANLESSGISTFGAPLRPIYSHLTELLLEATMNRNQVLGMVVELDLPELGISGPAWIVDLEPAPLVPAGPGQVVTATFKHASANVLDLVLTNTPPMSFGSSPTAHSPSPSALSTAPTDSIGVTANHPFWSVDRAEFVQAGELQIGERLQTLAGDIHWVQQKLPRPGPEPVYNLEVNDEHVYYVGTNGVLAHNAGKGYSNVQANKLAGNAARDAIRLREAPALIEQNFRVIGGLRRVDVLKQGNRIVAIESKVGRTGLSQAVRQELARDVRMLRGGLVDEVIWEFSRSAVTGKIGPTKRLLAKLRKFGITVR
ncbi:MAG: hypothetical protein JNL67_13790 [Planctomycetaceae bacterium]|nr:hypothetical protein [Planctomycetaceae bacterium]